MTGRLVLHGSLMNGLAMFAALGPFLDGTVGGSQYVGMPDGLRPRANARPRG